MAPLAVLTLSLLLAAPAAAATQQVLSPDHADQTSLLQTHVGAGQQQKLQAAAQVKVESIPDEGAQLLFLMQQAVETGGVQFSAALAEFIAMALFVIIGCGSAMGIAKEPGSAWVLHVSLTFGFAITSLAYAVGAYSGGHINCAVTLGLVLVGQCSVAQGILNVIGQLLGSLTGAFVLRAIVPITQDRTGGLGSNGVSEGFTKTNAFVGEVMMTFLLVFVVLETAVNPNSEANRALACVAIGFSVFLAHCVLIPIDGCSINPTRSFGPAYVAKLHYGKADTLEDLLRIFTAAPLLGSILAAAVYGILRAVA